MIPLISLTQENLESTDIIVEKEFEGIIKDAVKIDIQSPVFSDKDSVVEGEYNQPAYWMDVEYEKSKLRPVAMPDEIDL